MSFKIKTKTYIDGDYSKIVNKKINEKIVFNIINDSKIVFVNEYRYNENQFNGESDYLEIKKDKETRNIDLKILFYEQMCEDIAFKRINEWLNRLITYVNEVSDSVIKGIGKISDTQLYKDTIKRLYSLKASEDVILFFPFPISQKLEGSLSANLGTDNFQTVFLEIKKLHPELIKDRNIYLITCNIENKIVIMNIKTRNIEFMDNEYFSEYIKVDSIDVVGEAKD